MQKWECVKGGATVYTDLEQRPTSGICYSRGTQSIHYWFKA